jgi:hypothetical protein
MEISEDDFWAKYKPILNHLDNNASWNGSMFETYGAEYAYVYSVYKEASDCVWTICEEDGCLFISSGLHWVNRLGYLITAEPDESGNVTVNCDSFEAA